MMKTEIFTLYVHEIFIINELSDWKHQLRSCMFTAEPSELALSNAELIRCYTHFKRTLDVKRETSFRQFLRLRSKYCQYVLNVN
jgi:hypothetical protein